MDTKYAVNALSLLDKLFPQREMIDIICPFYVFMHDIINCNTELASIRTNQLVVPYVANVIRFYGIN